MSTLAKMARMLENSPLSPELLEELSTLDAGQKDRSSGSDNDHSPADSDKWFTEHARIQYLRK